MRRDDIIVAEMLTAAEAAVAALGERTPADLHVDVLGRDAILWNIAVLG